MKEAGKSVRALDERPALYPGLHMVWRAYLDLNARRQIGWQANPIAIESIGAWLDFNGVFDFELRRTVFRWVCFLDNTWLEEYQNKKGK